LNTAGSQTGAGQARWRGIAWFTVLSIAAVVAINAAGIWGVAVARRGLREDAARILRLETSERARSLEAVLARTRGELAFMAGSPVLFDLEAALQSRDPALARWRRLEAEGALLLFLRAHPEVMRVEALGSGGRPLLEAARRGGVPVLWMASGEAVGGASGAVAGAVAGAPAGAPPRRAIDPIENPIEGRFAPRLGTRSVRGAVTVEATIDAARFLFPGGTATPGRACVLADAEGRRIAGDAPAKPASAQAAAAAATADAMDAAVTLDADGWSVPSPWSLTCSETAGSTLAMFEPLAARYRTTLLLNLAAMSLAVVLGGIAIHQARRRRDVEVLAEEEARVRELERRLFHAERLSTVGRLAAGMAHEINNPLEGMANYLALLRSDLERGDRESARRRLEGVHEGLRRAEAVVHLVLAHADPARAPLGEVDLAATLRQAAEFVRSRREFAPIRFDFDLQESLPHVQGRQTLLGQVFLNIVLNACEAQPQGGEVRLAAYAAEGAVVVTIADRGPGIAAAESGRVFEPFYSTKGSTGLGLSTCYAIVEQHGGAIEAAQQPGGGAVFTIRLPMTASGMAGGVPAARAEGARG
jgi:signal transduction histidine kinase